MSSSPSTIPSPRSISPSVELEYQRSDAPSINIAATAMSIEMDLALSPYGQDHNKQKLNPVDLEDGPTFKIATTKGSNASEAKGNIAWTQQSSGLRMWKEEPQFHLNQLELQQHQEWGERDEQRHDSFQWQEREEREQEREERDCPTPSRDGSEGGGDANSVESAMLSADPSLGESLSGESISSWSSSVVMALRLQNIELQSRIHELETAHLSPPRHPNNLTDFSTADCHFFSCKSIVDGMARSAMKALPGLPQHLRAKLDEQDHVATLERQLQERQEFNSTLKFALVDLQTKVEDLEAMQETLTEELEQAAEREQKLLDRLEARLTHHRADESVVTTGGTRVSTTLDPTNLNGPGPTRNRRGKREKVTATESNTSPLLSTPEDRTHVDGSMTLTASEVEDLGNQLKTVASKARHYKRQVYSLQKELAQTQVLQRSYESEVQTLKLELATMVETNKENIQNYQQQLTTSQARILILERETQDQKQRIQDLEEEIETRQSADDQEQSMSESIASKEREMAESNSQALKVQIESLQRERDEALALAQKFQEQTRSILGCVDVVENQPTKELSVEDDQEADGQSDIQYRLRHSLQTMLATERAAAAATKAVLSIQLESSTADLYDKHQEATPPLNPPQPKQNADADTTIGLLQIANTTLRDEIDTLRAGILSRQDVERRISRSAATMLTTARAMEEATRTVMQSDIVQLKRQTSTTALQHKKELQESFREKTALERQLKTQEQKNTKIKCENKALRSKLVELSQVIINVSKEMQMNLDSVEKQRQDVEKELLRERFSNKIALEQAQATLASMLQAEEMKYAALHRTFVEQSEALSKSMLQTETLQKELEAATANHPHQIDSLKAHYEQKVQEANLQVQSLRQQACQLREEIDARSQREESLKAIEARTRLSLSSIIRTERSLANVKDTTATTQMQELRMQGERLMQLEEYQENQIHELTRQITGLKTSCESEWTKTNEFETENHALKSKVLALGWQIVMAETKYSTIESELATLRAEYHSYLPVVSKYERLNDALNVDLSKARETSNEKDDMIQELQCQNDELKSKVNELARDILRISEDMQLSVESLQKHGDQLQMEMRRELDDYRMTRDDIQGRLLRSSKAMAATERAASQATATFMKIQLENFAQMQLMKQHEAQLEVAAIVDSKVILQNLLHDAESQVCKHMEMMETRQRNADTKLASEISRKETEMRAYQREVVECRSQLSDVRGQLSDSLCKIESMQGELETTIRDNEQRMEIIAAKYDKEREEANNVIQTLSLQNQELCTEVEAMKSEIESYIVTVDSCRRNAETELVSAIANKDTELRACHVELRECKRELSDLRRRLSDASTKIVSLHGEFEKTTSDNSQRMESITALHEKELGSATMENHELSLQNQRLVTEVEQMKLEIESYIATIDSSRRNAETELVSTIAKKDGELRAYQDELRDCKHHLSDVRQQLSDSLCNIESLKLELETNTHENKQRLESMSVERDKERMETKSEIQKLDLEKQKLCKEVEALKAEISSCTEELECCRQHAEAKLRESQNHLTDVSQQLSTALSQIETLQRKFEKAVHDNEQRIGIMTAQHAKEVEEATSEIRNLQLQKENLQGNVERLTREIKFYMETVETSRREAETQLASEHACKMELRECQHQLSNVRHQLSDASSKIEALQLEVVNIIRDNAQQMETLTSQHDKELEEAHSEVRKLHSQKVNLDANIQRLTREIKFYTETLETCRREVEMHVASERATKAELRECNEQLSDLRHQLSDASSKIESLQRMLETNTQDSAQQREIMTSQHKNEVELVTDEIRNLLAQKEDLENKVELLTDEIQSYMETLATCRREAETHLAAERATKVELHECNDRLSDVRQQLSDSLAKIESLQDEIKETHNDNAQRMETMAVKHENELEEANSEIQNLRSLNEDLASKVDLFTDEIKSYKDVEETCRREVEMHKATERACKVELRERNEQLSDLRHQLSNASSTIVSLQDEIEKTTSDYRQRLESMTVEHDKERMETKSEIQKLDLEKQKLCKEVEALKAEISSCTEELECCRQHAEAKLRESQNHLTDVSQQLSTALSQIETLQRKFEKAVHDNEQRIGIMTAQHAKEVEEATSEIRNLQLQKENLQGNVEKLTLAVETSRREAESQLSSERACKVELRDCQQQLSEARQQLSDFSTMVESLRRELEETRSNSAKRNESMKAKHEKQRDEITQQQHQNSALKARLSDLSSVILHLSEQMKESVDYLRRTKDEMDRDFQVELAQERVSRTDICNRMARAMRAIVATERARADAELCSARSQLTSQEEIMSIKLCSAENALVTAQEKNSALDRENHSLKVQLTKTAEDLSLAQIATTSQVQDLQARVHLQEGQNMYLKKKLESQHQEYVDLQKEFHRQNVELARGVEELAEQLERKVAEQEQTSKNYVQAQSMIQSLENSLRLVSGSLKQSSLHYSEMQDRIMMMEKELASSRDAALKSMTDAEHKQSMIMELQARLKSTDHELASIRSNASEYMADAKEKEVRLELLATTLRKAERDLASTRDASSRYLSDCETKQEIIDDLVTKLAKTQEQLVATRAECDRYVAAVEEKEAELSELEENSKKIEECLRADCRMYLADAEKQHSELNAVRGTLEKTEKELAMSINNSLELTEKHEKLEEKLQEVIAVLEKKEIDIVTTQNECFHYAAETEKRERLFQNLQAKLQGTEAELVALRADFATSEGEIQRLYGLMNEYNDEAKMTDQALAAARADCSRHMAEIEELKILLNDSNERLKDLEEERLASLERVASLQESICGLEQANEDIHCALKACQSELDVKTQTCSTSLSIASTKQSESNAQISVLQLELSTANDKAQYFLEEWTRTNESLEAIFDEKKRLEEYSFELLQQNTRFQAEFANLSIRCSDVEEELREARNEFHSSESNRTTLEDELTKRNMELKESRNHVHELKKRIIEVQAMSDGAFEQIERLTKTSQNDIANLRNALEQHENELEAARIESSKLIARIHDLESEKENLHHQIIAKHDEIEDLRSENADLQHLVEKQDQHTMDLEKNIAAQIEQGKLKQSRIEEMKASLASATSALEELTKSNKALSSRIKDLETELESGKDSLTREIESLTQENSLLKDETSKMKEEIEAQRQAATIAEQTLGKELAEEKSSSRMLKELVGTLNTNNDALRVQCEKLQSKLTSAMHKVEERDTLVEREKKLRMKVDSLISANRQLDSQLLKTLDRNQLLEKKLAEAKDTIADMTEAIEKIAAENAQLLQGADAREASLAKEVVTMQLEIETLKRRLDQSGLDAEEVVDELRYELDELRHENNALLEERETLAAEIKSLQARRGTSGDLEAALLQNKALNTKLMEAEKSITELTMNAQQMQKVFTRDLENANAREASLAKEVVSLQLEVEGARRRLAAIQEMDSGDDIPWLGGDDVMDAKACRKQSIPSIRGSTSPREGTQSKSKQGKSVSFWR